MLAMTSWSGGVSTGWVRVKNLSKFSAPLPPCKRVSGTFKDSGRGEGKIEGKIGLNADDTLSYEHKVPNIFPDNTAALRRCRNYLYCIQI